MFQSTRGQLEILTVQCHKQKAAITSITFVNVAFFQSNMVQSTRGQLEELSIHCHNKKAAITLMTLVNVSFFQSKMVQSTRGQLVVVQCHKQNSDYVDNIGQCSLFSKQHAPETNEVKLEAQLV